MWRGICNVLAHRFSRMNTLVTKTALVAAVLCFGLTASAQGGSYDVFVPISKYIKDGNSENLSAWFADNLDITILSTSNNSSRNQAKQIIKSFFNTHTPRSFDITHRAGRSNMKYALGALNAGGEMFIVTIFVSSSGGGAYSIQQLKIDRME